MHDFLMDATILSTNYTATSVDLCRFSVENIPLYDSADDEPTSINKEILVSSDGMVTQYSNISRVQSTENPGNTGTNEFAPIIVDELTTSSNGLAPMNVEPLTVSSNEFTPSNAMPMVARLVENGSTGYSAQDTHDASQNSAPKAANHANQTGPQNNSNHSALVPVKPAPKRRGRKPKRVVHKQLDIPDICDRLTSSVACEEILYCEVMVCYDYDQNSLLLKQCSSGEQCEV
jgi:hypothetical protein